MMLTFYEGMGLFCLALLGVLYVSALLSHDNSNIQRMFRWTILASAATVCCDICGGAVYQGEYGAAVTWAVNIAYTFSESTAYLLWALHYLASRGRFPKGRALVPWVLPACLAVALCLMSPFNGAYISVDAAGVYSRGPLHPLYTVVVALPVVVVTLESLYRMVAARRKSDFIREFAMVSFIIPLLVCAILQVMWYDIPVLACGLTVGLLFVYINIQNQKITEDPITGLNNRFRMAQYIESRYERCRDWDGALYVAVMDIDHFTDIVAQHGNGDGTLIRVACALRGVCGTRDCFIAKFGGDEFLVARDYGTREEFESICDDVRARMEELSAELPYDLRLSIGTAGYAGQPTPRQLFDEADAAMYADKRARYESMGIRWTR
ncbi:MAG: GGDEF domain-containing protein [Thermoplasmata archaeon]|nr:GGDEF domain-containing protein [Thermoplasmata archaeon]